MNGMERFCERCGVTPGAIWIGPDDTAMCGPCMEIESRALIGDNRE